MMSRDVTWSCHMTFQQNRNFVAKGFSTFEKWVLANGALGSKIKYYPFNNDQMWSPRAHFYTFLGDDL